MSEFINNVSKKRQEKLKEIILSIHNGISLEEAKKEFKAHFQDVSTHEITQMEQSLMQEGMSVAEVQRLCDVHAAVFEGSISDIHGLSDYENIKGHPVRIFKLQNERILQLIEEEIEPYIEQKGKTPDLMLRVGYDRLKEIHNHYARKEYLLFPKLEKVGITGPPKVMWGVDDEIRAEIKEVIDALSKINYDPELVREKIRHNVMRIKDMVFKEENILMPMMIEHMSFFDWVLVDASSDEIGYFSEKPNETWVPKDEEEIQSIAPNIKEGEVYFDAGSLTFEQVNQMLNVLPFDMTFVDHEGYVKYFTQGKERIFDRPKTIIGRHVSMCHPPQSVHIVEDIIESFKSGRKDNEDFWISLKDIFVHIRYFAVRSKTGEYLGTLEITQNIKPIKELTGEKRLVSKE